MSANDQPLHWRGAHHLALVTRDLDATVRFYHGVLGMPLFGAMAAQPHHGRHCLFQAGGFIMHFFEQPDAAIPAPPSGWEEGMLAFVPGAYQHLALALEDETSLLTLRERLLTAGVAVTPMMQEGPIRFFRFVDNNGIPLEPTWAPFDSTAMPIDYSHRGLFSDPDPVPAVRELTQEGRLRR